jgi:hypothetical protein
MGRASRYGLPIRSSALAGWGVHFAFFVRRTKASERPPSPMQIGVIYRSTDGHESVSLSQSAAQEPNPYRRMGHGEDWEDVTQGGIAMNTSPPGRARRR